MLRSVLIAVAVFFAAAAVPSVAKAADSHKAGEHGEAKYKAAIHGPKGEEVDKEFDLANPEQRKELFEKLERGEVGHLHQEEKMTIGKILGLKRWDLGIWSILIFLAILFVLGKFAWKPMLQGLQEREEKIRTALDLAEQTRKEAAEQHAKLQSQLAAGAAEVREKIEEARRDAIALKDQMMAEARAEIQTERARLHREIETAKDAALEELWEKSVNLATQLSTKAIRRQLTADDHRRLLDETLSELKPDGNRLGAL